MGQLNTISFKIFKLGFNAFLSILAGFADGLPLLKVETKKLEINPQKKMDKSDFVWHHHLPVDFLRLVFQNRIPVEFVTGPQHTIGREPAPETAPTRLEPLEVASMVVDPSSRPAAEAEQKKIPSGYVKIAIENDHRNSGFSH